MRGLETRELGTSFPFERVAPAEGPQRQATLSFPDVRPAVHAGAPRSSLELASEAATLRARYALVRAAQEFLDRDGFVEAPGPPAEELGRLLGRVYWATRGPGEATMLSGHLHGTDGFQEMIDLLERFLLSSLHGLVNRARANLLSLGVDVDMLKYLVLPVRRVDLGTWMPNTKPERAGVDAQYDDALLRQFREPLVAGLFGPEAGISAWCRLLLPGSGCMAGAMASGAFTVDLDRLATFATQPRFAATLARPPGGHGPLYMEAARNRVPGLECMSAEARDA